MSYSYILVRFVPVKLVLKLVSNTLDSVIGQLTASEETNIGLEPINSTSMGLRVEFFYGTASVSQSMATSYHVV